MDYYVIMGRCYYYPYFRDEKWGLEKWNNLRSDNQITEAQV